MPVIFPLPTLCRCFSFFLTSVSNILAVTKRNEFICVTANYIFFSCDYASFLKLVRIGDRLEMKRDGYCHWAIFVGEQFIQVEEEVRGQTLLEY